MKKTKLSTLPFDLKTALAEPVRLITRDGRKVQGLVDFLPFLTGKHSNTDQPLYGVVNEVVDQWCIDGRYYAGGDTCKYDLVLINPDGADAAGWMPRSNTGWQSLNGFWTLSTANGQVRLASIGDVHRWDRWQPLVPPPATLTDEDEDEDEN